MSKIILQTDNLTKTFGAGRTATRAVSNISLSVQEGEIVLIMGPSGSGKTTLLTMIGGLLHPTSGKIIYSNKAIENYSQHQLTRLRRQNIGFIFQSFNLLENLCAWENVYIAGFNVNSRKKKAIDLLISLGLKSRLHAKPKELSGGERQRVAIARSLINDPKIILADEPTANLDRAIGHEVMQLLCSIACRQGKAVIIVSHDERIKDFANRILYIEDGKLTKSGRGAHDKNCQMKRHR